MSHSFFPVFLVSLNEVLTLVQYRF